MISLPRRASLLALVALVACTKRPRCERCGMVLEPGSRFGVELVDGGKTRGFDTPKCAASVWLREGKRGELFVVEHYSGARTPARDLTFALGSDVLGPMGHDLVPVARAHKERFARDHAPKSFVSLDDLTQTMVDDL